MEYLLTSPLSFFISIPILFLIYALLALPIAWLKYWFNNEESLIKVWWNTMQRVEDIHNIIKVVLLVAMILLLVYTSF